MSSRLRAKRTARDRPSGRQPPAPLISPQILWPSITYRQAVASFDVPHFPETDRVYERHRTIESGTHRGLRAFEEAVTGAEAHVLVLDPHFDRQGAQILADALLVSQVRDVRLITGRRHLAKQERADLANMLTDSCNEGRLDNRQVEVHWSATLDTNDFPFLHDRFAIVDGALWHFGATVGGGHAGLTAASGPWPAVKTRAVFFFNECWRRSNA